MRPYTVLILFLYAAPAVSQQVEWSPLGTGVDAEVRAIAVSGNDVYVGGNFTEAGGIAASAIARWDGSSWSALGSGIGGAVYAIAVDGDDVYVGGVFTAAGGAPASYVARWDGQSWSPLAGGTRGAVHSLAIVGDDLYAGGEFISIGGAPADYLARWDGTSWHDVVGSSEFIRGSKGPVLALTADDEDLYVGGEFSHDMGGGGNFANNVALWNGTDWLGLGDGNQPGVAPIVYAIDVAGSDVYVGGRITEAGEARPYDLAVNNIALWDGESWSALGSGTTGDPNEGISGHVYAIAAFPGAAYVGGNFNKAGDVAANSIAKWDGSNWTSLGTGVNSVFGPTSSPGHVRAIVEYPAGGTIIVGGYFNDKGNSIAQFKDLGGPLSSENGQPDGFLLRQNFPNPFNPTTTISYEVPDSGPVSLKIFNALGVEVAEIVSEFRPAGSYSHTFDAGDLGSGLYFYQLRTGSVTATKSMTLIK